MALKSIGLTGGVGMGKSTAASYLAGFGIDVIDTDDVARQVVEPGQPALEEIRTRFGDEVISPEGFLRRDEVARLVFRDAKARADLEAILHPRIRRVWMDQVDSWRNANRQWAVVVIPLLFETNAASHFDATICIACSEQTQRRRLEPRGWTPEQMAMRIHAQWPVDRKMTGATFVIWSEGDVIILGQQLQHVLKQMA
jgi:dephospho-CoA kinase